MVFCFKDSLKALFTFLLFFTFLANTSSAIQAPLFNNYKLSIGFWRAEIIRADGHVIPFIFQTKITSGKLLMYVINGSEHLLVDNIRQKGDSVFIEMPFFDSHFALRIADSENLNGSWIKNYGDRQVIVPFHAVFNEDERYPDALRPVFNISGKWSVRFKGSSDSTEAVGEFIQKGSQVTGTFLTSTGDYRYLDGVVSRDTLKLSTFDGGHAYSFISRITDSTSIEDGFFYASATSVETWTAKKNKNAQLPDEYSLTHLKDLSKTRLHFKFPDLNGRLISLNDPIYKNKVVIIQIMGSWCPNCMDETRFLAPYFLKNKTRGIEVIGLAYERTTSMADAKKLLQPFITRFNVTYPILFTGVTVSDSLRTEKTLPEIQQIIGFPTTIFIDRKGLVRKIHTGFNGPGTGKHYEIYKKEFDDLVNQLLNE